MIRVAALGDLHVGEDTAGVVRSALSGIEEHADALLLAGDLTKMGLPGEARVLADELSGLPVPCIAVLGNHDHHAERPGEVVAALQDGGVTVLEGEGIVIDTPGGRLGVAGAKGFGGGFAGACGSDFGELEMKVFVRHTMETAARLEAALEGLEADVRVALLHYSPVRETLVGEPPEIYPFLGSYLLAEAIDRAGADLALHGHAHRGTERGVTPGGVHVRNVAQHVLNAPYAVYSLEPRERVSAGTAAGSTTRSPR